MLAVIPLLFALTGFTNAHPAGHGHSHGHAKRDPSWGTQCETGFAYSWDDGPYIYHGQINDAFKKVNGSTTFFVNGFNWGCIYDDDNVAALRASYEAGHQIAHHTWSHPFLTQQNKTTIDIEIQRLNEAFVKILGVKPKWLRPPYGDINDDVASYIKTNYGLNIVTWDIDSQDTSATKYYQDETVQYEFYQTLSHDGPSKPHMPLSHETKEWSVEALTHNEGTPKLLTNAGYSLITIAECMGGTKDDMYEVVTGYYGTKDSTWTCSGSFTPTPVGGSSTPTGTANPTSTGTASPTSTGTASPTCAQTYTSKAGDTCASIGSQFGLTAAQITAANTFLNCNDIWAYTPICIPAGSSSPTTATAPTTTTTAPTCVQTYSAVSGDTCTSIGQKYGLSAAAILAANTFLNCNDIWAYTPVCIPAGGSTATSSSATSTPSCASTYTAVAGDTCATIGSKYGLSADAILAANTFLTCNDIWAYTPICIPSGGTSASVSSVCTKTISSAAGDTCASIASQYGTTASQIQAWNTFLTCNDIWTNTPVCVQH